MTIKSKYAGANLTNNKTNRTNISSTSTEYGSFFYALTGKAVSSCHSLEDIDRNVEEAIGKNIDSSWYKSKLISPRGSVFPTRKAFDVDKEIDKQLA